MNVQSNQACSTLFPTHNAFGAAADADEMPTGTLYVSGTANAAVITVTKVATGLYKAAFTTPAGMANFTGLELHIQATMGGINARGRVWSASVLVFPPSAIGQTESVDEDSTTLNCKVGETGVTKTLTLVDGNGDPQSWLPYGDLKVVFERLPPSRADVEVIEMEDLAISGDNNEILTLTPGADVLSVQRNLGYSVRQVSTNKSLMDGLCMIRYAASEDAP